MMMVRWGSVRRDERQANQQITVDTGMSGAADVEAREVSERVVASCSKLGHAALFFHVVISRTWQGLREGLLWLAVMGLDSVTLLSCLLFNYIRQVLFTHILLLEDIHSHSPTVPLKLKPRRACHRVRLRQGFTCGAFPHVFTID